MHNVISHCGFDLHFLIALSSTFHVPIGHHKSLEILFPSSKFHRKKIHFYHRSLQPQYTIFFLSLIWELSFFHLKETLSELSHAQLCDPMDCSTPGSSVLRYLLEFAQIYVHRVGDAI